MRRRHPVRGRRVAGLTLTVAVCELSLAGYAALQPRTNFLATGFFERISATTDEGENSESAENG